MGSIDLYEDAMARGDFLQAFRLAIQILNRKGSKRLINLWVYEAVKCLKALGNLDILPDFFEKLSVYGKREELNRLFTQLNKGSK